MTRVKKYLPFAIALLLGLAFLVFVGVSNESKKAHNIRGVFWGETVEDTANLPGKGTKYDPYRIDSTETLCRFRDNVNRGYSYYGAYVRQTADLDLSGIENWVPIGIFGTENLFEGYYDGAGHTISNLTIHAPGENVGLFGILGGTVVNLGVPSGTIEGNCIGTIASHSGHSGARIVNCYSGAALIGNRMGGMADNFDGAMIYNCLFFGSLSAPVGNGFPVLGGGIAGYAGNVIDCFSTTADICSADFTGVVTDRLGTFYREGTDEIKDPDAILRVLNDNREPLTVNVLGGQPAYGWSRTEGGISQVRKINWYPVRFLLVALAATALLLALNLWLVTKGREELPAEGEGGKGALLKARFAAGVRELGAVRFWFLFALQAVLLYNVLAVLCGNSASLYALTYDQCTGLFCDFFVPLKTMTSDGIPMREYYARTGDIYPPMAVLFFRFVALFIPEEFRAFDARFERSVHVCVHAVLRGDAVCPVSDLGAAGKLRQIQPVSVPGTFVRGAAAVCGGARQRAAVLYSALLCVFAVLRLPVPRGKGGRPAGAGAGCGNQTFSRGVRAFVAENAAVAGNCPVRGVWAGAVFCPVLLFRGRGRLHGLYPGGDRVCPRQHGGAG